MNFKLANKLNSLLQENRLEEAIEFAETKLRKLPKTDFHKVLDKDILHLKTDLSNYLTTFYESAIGFYKNDSKGFQNAFFKRKRNIPEKELKAIYCEMNDFTINYDRWFVDLFAYSFYKGIKELDWLAEFEFYTENNLTITGFKELQITFHDYMENEKWKDKELEKSMEICELLIVLRLQQLFKHTFIENKENQIAWTNIPILVTAHDYDMIYEIEK